jgi:hypothetical protein
MFRSPLAIIALALACAAHAQSSISPEKEKLIQQLLQLWHVENVALTMLQAPIDQSLRQARGLLQGRATEAQQAAALKDIAEYTKNFYLEAEPVVLGSAKKFIPSTVAPILAEKFSEQELRQIIALLESPVKSKFEKAIPEMQRALGQKIAAETGGQITPKMEKLQQQIGERMRTAITP